MRTKIGVWTEDKPRTIDILMKITLYLFGISILNTILICWLVWNITR